MSAQSDAADAGSLLALGLTGRVPSEGSEYARVLARYGEETPFRELVDAFATGLGLVVVRALPTGLVLAGQPGSPFGFRLSDLGLATADQQLFGLVLLGIAALAYPTEAHLDAPAAQIVSVDRVERFMRASVERLRTTSEDEASVDAWIASAARLYDGRPAFIPTKVEKRAAKGCTQRTIEDVFGWLVTQKMARVGAGLGPNTFLLTDRFRVMVGDIAGPAAMEVLMEIARVQRAADEVSA